jgi:hypothetical protein
LFHRTPKIVALVNFLLSAQGKKALETIEIKITEKERDLIVDHTFAGDDLTKQIKLAEMDGKYLLAKYTIEDLDELVGYIAAESNHTEDPKLQKQLDRLFEKLSRIIENNDA